MYLSEIAPVHVRGSLGTLSQFGIVTGILIGNVLGMKVVRDISFVFCLALLEMSYGSPCQWNSFAKLNLNLFFSKMKSNFTVSIQK